MADILDRLRAALADRYAIERELGAGGMATVYLAHDRKLNRAVALKVLRPELAASLGAERFLREIEIAARLTHPNILALHDCGAADGLLYYTMPYVEGDSLRDRLNREKQLSLEDALQITREVADALGYAHSLGLVHRDIKPENILFTAGHAVVSDFGIARAVSSAGAARLTETGLAVGTPAYMSPEQATADPAVDARSDVYALGAVLYEMLCGEPPHSGPTTEAILARLLTQVPVPPRVIRSGVPEGVSKAVLKALAKAPVDRFATAGAFAAALKAPAEAAAPEKSLVVLPFENLSPDPDNAFFADGLTEELIADLSKVRALRVISRTSAMQFKGTTKGVPAIARELNVRYALEGSVRRAGNSVRITAQLIDAVTDAHLWAEKYAGTLEDVFDLQERLSRRIVEALMVTLAPEEDRRLAGRDIPDVEAFTLYLRACQEMYRLTQASLDLAVQLLQRALERTGPNALLLATAAEITWWLHDQAIRPGPELLDRADELATRALELAPDLARAHMAKGLVAWRRFDTKAGVQHVRRAAQLGPGDATVAFSASYVLVEVGCTDEARLLGERAVALDPLSWLSHLALGMAFFFDGRFESALPHAARMHEVGAEIPPAELWYGIFLLYAGRSEEAGVAFAHGAAAGAGVVSQIHSFLGAMLRRDVAAMRAGLAEQAVSEHIRIDKELSWWAAAAFASVGDTDEALRWLSGAIEMGFINHRFFAEHDPFLARLRGDPRFEALMEGARDKQQEIESCAPGA